MWRGLNNPSLSLREPYAVAYDSISRRLVMSAQDTGSAYQSAPGSSTYNGVGGGGDGVNAAVNDTTLREQGRQRDLHDLAEPGAADAPGGRCQLAPCCDTDFSSARARARPT